MIKAYGALLEGIKLNFLRAENKISQIWA